jgi:hypothetical protein
MLTRNAGPHYLLSTSTVPRAASAANRCIGGRDWMQTTVLSARLSVLMCLLIACCTHPRATGDGGVGASEREQEYLSRVESGDHS